MSNRIASLFCVLFLCVVSPARADDSAIAKELTSKGVKITETNGNVAGIDVPSLSQMNDGDFQRIAAMTHLQKLSFGKGLADQHLQILTNLPDVVSFTTNGSELDDKGVAELAGFKKLQVLTFFHPGKNFTGLGLSDLAALPNLESLTVAGSSVFGNDGMSAIAKLQHLKSLRVWHTNADSEGVSLLKALPGLTSITLGQRLAYKPPTMVADDTVGIVASMKSLESVSLSESRLSLDALSQLKSLPSLKRLTLDGIDIPESDIDQLRKLLPTVQIKWTAVPPESKERIGALFDNAPR